MRNERRQIDGTFATVELHSDPAFAAEKLSVTIEERFWSKVDINGPVPTHCPHLGPCAIWTGLKIKTGYGRIGRGRANGGMILAHRLSWLLHFKFLIPELHVLHHCDNPSCIRATHLFIGTDADNVRDMCLKGRHANTAGLLAGELHPESKLTWQQVGEIRQMYIKGITKQRDIAAQFNVSQRLIWNIVNNKAWII